MRQIISVSGKCWVRRIRLAQRWRGGMAYYEWCGRRVICGGVVWEGEGTVVRGCGVVWLLKGDG